MQKRKNEGIRDWILVGKWNDLKEINDLTELFS